MSKNIGNVFLRHSVDADIGRDYDFVDGDDEFELKQDK